MTEQESFKDELDDHIAESMKDPEYAELEECSYCWGWYPRPVAYHHSEEECDREQSAGNGSGLRGES